MSQREINITIFSESFLLAGSGEGSALIDADIVYHKSGFPLLPARRVKGLLKESLVEAMEIMGIAEGNIDSVIGKLFGITEIDRPTGKLRFTNLHIKDWDEIKSGLVIQVQKYPYELSPENIRQFFTSEIQQTALDDGIARHRSLRNYRVLNPGFTFSGTIEIVEKLNDEEQQWLQHAAAHLRYMGVRRNRGFGKIKCELNFQDVVTALSAASKIKIEPGTALKVRVKTNGPVVLALNQGDQNTVFTEKIINGNRFLGALAAAYIQAHPDISWENAHLSDSSQFREIFLSGKVQFTACTFEGAGPIPFNIHQYKGHKEWGYIDVFRKENILEQTNQLNERQHATTKPVRGYGRYDTQLVVDEVKTTFNFHHARTNRAAGRSTDAEIFYYESMDEGQCFEGQITGDVVLINELLKVLNIENSDAALNLQIGRSRSAQYGNISITFSTTEATPSSLPMQPNTQYLLIALSPLILRNVHGQFEANRSTLKAALGGLDLTFLNAVARIREIEQYRATWKAKSGKVPAFEAGSTFLVQAKAGISNFPTTIGEWQEQGFGRIELIKQDDFPETIENKAGVVQVESITDAPPSDRALHSTLKGIIHDFTAKQNEIQLKAAASANAAKWGCLTNSLLSRLLLLITNATSFKAVKTELDNMKEKIAGKTIKEKDEGLWNELYECFNQGAALNEEEQRMQFTLEKIYWKNLFITARKKMKNENDRNKT